MADLNQAKHGPLVYEDLSISNKESSYTFNGLSPSTIYRVHVTIEFVKAYFGRVGGEYKRLGAKMRSDGSLKPLRSKELFIMTRGKLIEIEGPVAPIGYKNYNKNALSIAEKTVE